MPLEAGARAQLEAGVRVPHARMWSVLFSRKSGGEFAFAAAPAARLAPLSVSSDPYCFTRGCVWQRCVGAGAAGAGQGS